MKTSRPFSLFAARSLFLLLAITTISTAQTVNPGPVTAGCTVSGSSGVLQVNNGSGGCGGSTIDDGGTTAGTVTSASEPWSVLNGGTGFTFGSGVPWTNNAVFSVNTGSYPALAFVTIAKHLSGVRGAVMLPVQVGGASTVPIGLSGYGMNLNAGGASFGGFTNSAAGAASQLLTGFNPTVSDCNHKLCDSGSTAFATISETTVEADMVTGSSGTQTGLIYSGYNSPTSLYQPSNLSVVFYTAKPAATIGSVSFAGTGLNDVTSPDTTYTGNGPGGRIGDVAGLALQIDGTPGGADTYRWSTFINTSTCSASGCQTGSDFIIGAGNTISSAASHYFTTGDASGGAVQIISGTGCTAGTYTINSASAGVATLASSPGSASSTCVAAVWQATAVAFTGTATDIALVLPADSTAAVNLNGAAIRPLATSYGLNFQVNALTGHTLNANWSWSLSGIPTIHYGMRVRPGAADIGIGLDPIYNGPNLPSSDIQLAASDQGSNSRVTSIYASSATSTSALNFAHLNTAAAAFYWYKGTNCKYGGCVLLGDMDNQGTLVISGGVMGTQGLPSISNTGSTTLSAATSYLTTCAGNGTTGTTGNCMIGGTVVRSGQNAGSTDTTDTAADMVTLINSQNSNMCRVGMGWTWNYQNAGTNSITLAAGAGVTFQPSASIVVVPGYTVQMTAVVTNCGTAAVTMAALSNSPTAATRLTSWMSPFVGATTTALAGTNDIAYWAFSLPVTVSFSNIYAVSATADASNSYSLAIINSSGTLMCHPTSGSHIPTASTLWTNACSEGTVVLNPGTYLLLFTGNSTTGAVKTTAANLMVGDQQGNNLSGCTSSSGVISGTCSVSLSPAIYAVGIPNFTLQ